MENDDVEGENLMIRGKREELLEQSCWAGKEGQKSNAQEEKFAFAWRAHQN